MQADSRCDWENVISIIVSLFLVFFVFFIIILLFAMPAPNIGDRWDLEHFSGTSFM